MAEKVRDVVLDEGQSTVAVGEFVGPAQHPSNFGAGLQQLLGEELEAVQKGIVNAGSVLSVKGDYEFIQAGAAKVIQLSVTIRKSTGEKVGRLARQLTEEPRTIRDSEVIAAMLGANVPLPPAKTRQELTDDITDKVKKPGFHREGARVSVSENSPFAVELLVTSRGSVPKDADGWRKVAPRAVQDEGGLPFVDIRRDEVYAVRVFNKTGHDAAVTLHIDGLDVFTFSELRGKEGRPRYSHFIAGPGECLITGWHKTNERTDSFLVTEYGKGAVSQAKAARGKVGVLTLTFALAWRGDDVPSDEKGSRNAGGNETGFGPPAKVALKEVERKVGVVREVLSLRYSR